MQNKLVDAEKLLEILFDKDSRPSLRWLREQQSTRAIPHIKLGHLVRFDVEEVKEAIKGHTVRTEKAASGKPALNKK